MTQSFIILAQSVTGAVVFIIALLLVAAIIGYFTAWFYAKSIYKPIIKGLETEKADLKKQISVLNDKVNKLNGDIEKLNEKNKELDEMNKELNEKIEALSEKNGNLEKAIEEKDKEIKQLINPVK